MQDAPPVLREEEPYRDRSGWLIFFGVVQILIGVVFVLLTLFMLASQWREGGLELIRADLLTSMLSFIFAIIVIMLGAGLTTAQRWARKLSQILAWITLVVGVLIFFGLMLYFPLALRNIRETPGISQSQTAAAETALLGAFVVALALLAAFLIALPAVMAWFYGTRHVKTTCEDRNPEPSWTDACPTLVLAMTAWQMNMAVTLLLSALLSPPVVAMFGVVILGWQAKLANLLMAVAAGLCAWLLYRLHIAGWWLLLLLTCASATSTVANILVVDQDAMYKLMGFTEAGIAQLRNSPFGSGLLEGVGAAASCAIWIVLLLVVLKHFRPARAPAN